MICYLKTRDPRALSVSDQVQTLKMDASLQVAGREKTQSFMSILALWKSFIN